MRWLRPAGSLQWEPPSPRQPRALRTPLLRRSPRVDSSWLRHTPLRTNFEPPPKATASAGIPLRRLPPHRTPAIPALETPSPVTPSTDAPSAVHLPRAPLCGPPPRATFGRAGLPSGAASSTSSQQPSLCPWCMPPHRLPHRLRHTPMAFGAPHRPPRCPPPMWLLRNATPSCRTHPICPLHQDKPYLLD